MKQLLLTLALALTVSLSFGQKKKGGPSAEKMAAANTKEMVSFLGLDAEQEAAMYKIHLEKSQKLIANKTDGSLTDEEKKTARKAIYKEAQIAFKNIISAEELKSWNQHKRSQKKKK